jgi:acyl-CoA synthetase (NDP forming)
MGGWVDAVTALALLPAAGGRGVFVIGGGGGNSVAYSDTCIRHGLKVPALSPDTMEKLRRSVPAAGSIAGNPLDMFRVFQDAAYLAEVLDLAYEDPAVSMVMVDRLIHRKAFHLMDVSDITPQIIEFLQSKPHRKPTVFTVDSDGGDPELAQTGAVMRARFCSAGVPAFPNVKRAARSLFQLYRYHRMKRGDKARKGEPAMVRG